MKVFTYKQYIECIHTLRLNAVIQLAEGEEQYYLESKEKKNIYDKIIKDVLNDIEEAKKFIRGFIESKEVLEISQLERYQNIYLDQKYKSKEANLIYKIKNREIFFLIEYQDVISSSVRHKILNKCIDIMQEWSRGKRNRKDIVHPIIVPIVIYTGDEIWKETKISEKKIIGQYLFEKYEIDLEYNLIDINKISKETLLEKNTMFAYIMLLQKSVNKLELIDNLSIIRKTSKSQEKVEKLIQTINYLLRDTINQNLGQEVEVNINKKVGGSSISTLYDRLLNENKTMIKMGEIKSQKEIVKKMINKNIEENIILETTGITKKDLEKIKNQLLEAG